MTESVRRNLPELFSHSLRGACISFLASVIPYAAVRTTDDLVASLDFALLFTFSLGDTRRGELWDMFGGTTATSTRRSKLLNKKLFVSFLTVERFQGIREEFFSRFNQLIDLKEIFLRPGIEFVQEFVEENYGCAMFL